MDTKLEKMYKIIVLIILVSVLSCSKKHPTIQSDKIEKVELAKGVFFKKCLAKGFNNSDEIKSILKYDKSYLSDMKLNIEELRAIDSLVDVINEYSVLDSIKSGDKWASQSGEMDYLIGKKIIYHCLKCFESDQIQSIIK